MSRRAHTGQHRLGAIEGLARWGGATHIMVYALWTVSWSLVAAFGGSSASLHLYLIRIAASSGELKCRQWQPGGHAVERMEGKHICTMALRVHPYFVQRDPSIGTGALRISLQWHYGFTHTLYRESWTSAVFQLNSTCRPMPSELGKYDK